MTKLQDVDPSWKGNGMITKNLTLQDRVELLAIARDAIESVVKGKNLAPLKLENFSDLLQKQGASFVTLTTHGQLRGCIGALEAYQPLVMDVREHAIAAATQDYRFPPVKPEELGNIKIEISRLTLPQKLSFEDPVDLISKLRPGIDGVILRDGPKRATFLPQVWEKIEDPVDFLNHLCSKMGVPPGTWRTRKMDVSIYQVEEIHEQ